MMATKNFSRHAEWLSLVEVSGPFLAMAVLEKVFPQGLDKTDANVRRRVRSAYEEWCDAIESDDSQREELHEAWMRLVLGEVLEFDAEVLKDFDGLDKRLVHEPLEHSSTFSPSLVVRSPGEGTPIMLVSFQSPGTDLERVQKSDGWPSSPLERMISLCRSSEVRLGLITNGERWTLVNAPLGETSSQASWHARLWFQEPVTLKAFQSLLSVRRFFGPEEETVTSLIDESLQHHEEVTDTLGEQVRRAVEVLVQCLDKADQDRNRELLRDVSPAELYEAGLTIMMRLVFLLCAEERELLLVGDPVYDQNYAVSTIRGQLAEESDRFGPEVLERRHDSWARLLAIFRVVFGGVEHETLRMPALGGSLFDPDRFPFLEGRDKGTSWREHPARPLPIDNRTVLLLLNALQLLEQKGGALALSYKALDVEQIGHVYEGLLEHTVERLPKVTLGFTGAKKAKNPNLILAELESARMDGEKSLIECIKETTQRSPSAIKNALKKKVDEDDFSRLLAVVGGDLELARRIEPYINLLRTDAWGEYIVYKADSFAVTLGADRRETGTHYTPKSLTESIVETTLEPIVYEGPAEGKAREDWKLKTSTELLDLKICDPAMGSGAFLVQVCRWLSQKVVEAWNKEEAAGKVVDVDGNVLDSLGSADPMPDSMDDRLLFAKRLVAERCLYGIDINPLAVELAKLSIWLITLAKGRPFGFLDHNLKSGDSLLGIHTVEQLTEFTLHPEGKNRLRSLFAPAIEKAVVKAIEFRMKIRNLSIRDITDIRKMEDFNEKSLEEIRRIELVGNALIGESLRLTNGQSSQNSLIALSESVHQYLSNHDDAPNEQLKVAISGLSSGTQDDSSTRKPFHWPLHFPEVFVDGRSGFDAMVGNPPFVGGQLISGLLGNSYRDYLYNHLTYEKKTTVDLVVYFFLRAFLVVGNKGTIGFLARRSLAEGKNRETGLDQILIKNGVIFSAITDRRWPGNASVVVHQVHIIKGRWLKNVCLNQKRVSFISSYLNSLKHGSPKKLKENSNRVFQGSILLGEGFKISEESAEEFVTANNKNRDAVAPFIGGSEVNGDPIYSPQCWAISFWDWPLPYCKKYSELFQRVEELVKPERDKLGGNATAEGRKKKWWLYGRDAKALYHAAGRGDIFHSHPKDWDSQKSKLESVLVISTGVTKYPAFTFLPNIFIFSNKLCVVADERNSLFAIVSSDIHNTWAWAQKTSMGGDLYSLVYAHGNIFETFPFPDGFMTGAKEYIDLEDTGQVFFEMRQKFMTENSVGLTQFYNLFHDQEKKSEALTLLRQQQQQINKTVLEAYGWEDIEIDYGFHEVGYLPQGSNVRHTVSEEAREEILNRLVELNQNRFEKETKQNNQNAGATKSSRAKKRKSPKKENPIPGLFDSLESKNKRSS